MKIQYCSDLHLEFPKNKRYIQANPIIPKAEILILVGDIIPFVEIEKHDYFFDDVSDKFKHVYWVAGNHEYYHSDLKLRQGKFQETIRENVLLINNSSVVHGDVKIIFSTLWTSISPQNALSIQFGLNDFRLIKYGTEKLTTQIVNIEFEKNIAFIQKSLTNNEDEKCVIVTHHIPTFDHYPPEYLGSKINEAFAVDLNEFIENNSIDFWIYGHHHRNVVDFKIGKTTMLTNQLGYVRANEHALFKTDKIFEI